MKYVNVIVDNNTDATDAIFTYAAEDDNISLGQHVKVPFSMHNRMVDAYVVDILEKRPEGIKLIKKISEYDPDVYLTEEALKTASWMHQRYLCRYIEAIKCFLPFEGGKRATKDPFENVEINEADALEKNLNSVQKKAKDNILRLVEDGKHDIVLLQGVTGSGKTEVYLQVMKKVIESGRQGIILVPEIALTPQLVSRFMSRFGKESVAILHSKLTPAQKAVRYRRIAAGEVSLVIGARSAIFAPFKNIGLIVLDEEHETSYKSDKNPKYDTIELAAKRAMSSNALLLLGSATPSVADYYRSEEGIFKRIEMPARYNSNPLPKAEIVDMTNEARSGNRNVFSSKLANEIADCLKNKKQVILFLNRRGYSSYISCRECGFVVKCKDCGLAMPYHKESNACVCHYCGRKVALPKLCPECQSKIIGRYGVGTEQIEEKAKELFPDANIERLDLDSIKKKGQLESVLKRFEKGKTDILIGTQLVAKGLDFENVGLVGVISADVTLNLPDYRAAERTFQLITQAAGRAGRGSEQGKVIIQTYSPENYAVVYSSLHDYKSFYEREINVRKVAGYPPFSDIFQIMIQAEDSSVARKEAEISAAWLKTKIPEEAFVLGPTASALVKQNGLYRYQILIKASKGLRKDVTLIVADLKKKHLDDKSKSLLTTDINPFSYI